MVNAQIIVLIAAAIVAALFAVRLYVVIGRRTGTEREPSQSFDPGTAAPLAARPRQPDVAKLAAGPVQQRGLFDIQLADRAFDTANFLAGAKHAYEIVVTAYAANDRMALRPLLNDEVWRVFDAAMRAREERGEKVAFSFSGFRDVSITAAVLKERIAEITVEFAARFVSSTTNASGQIVEGDATLVREVIDSWTFSHDIASGDPNWILVATAGPEAL